VKKMTRKAEKNFFMAIFPTSWGKAGIAWSEMGLCKVVLPGPAEREIRRIISSDFPSAEKGGPEKAGDMIEQIQAYFDGERLHFDMNLDLGWATPFQMDVYRALMTIPAAETWSYGRLAESCGHAGAARAVGTANSGNRIPLVVPCHRVIRSDGGLGGFSAPSGPDLKKRLLEHERSVLAAIKGSPL